MSPSEEILAGLRAHIAVLRQTGMSDSQFEEHARIVRITAPMTEDEAATVRAALHARDEAEQTRLRDIAERARMIDLDLTPRPAKGHVFAHPLERAQGHGSEPWGVFYLDDRGQILEPHLLSGQSRTLVIPTLIEEAQRERLDLSIAHMVMTWEQVPQAFRWGVWTILVPDGVRGSDHLAIVSTQDGRARQSGSIAAATLPDWLATVRDGVLAHEHFRAPGGARLIWGQTMFDLVEPDALKEHEQAALAAWMAANSPAPCPAPEPRQMTKVA